MTEHFPRSTVSVSLWCAKCCKYTQHRIDGVKKGPCEECVAELERRHKLNEAIRLGRATEEKQGELFG
jgi:ribosomal protein L44E